MGFRKEKEKLWFFVVAFAILFLACFFQGMNAYARQRGQYTSVTVEYRDADTGEIFHTYMHPWQRIGKKYTYYAEEKISQEGKGCYWYDEGREGAATEIASLSQKAEENRVVLYYNLYNMEEDEYAVNVTYKDTDTEEVIRSDVLVIKDWPGEYFSFDMAYCMTGNDEKTYLYDMENKRNRPITEMNANPEKNQIILYYRQGQIKEGEAIVEVYYRCHEYNENKFLAKSYIAGLAVGESYVCQDEDILNLYEENRIYHPSSCYYYFSEEKSSLSIEALSENSKENVIEIQHRRELILTGLPPQYRSAFFSIRYIDEDTGDVLTKMTGGTSLQEIYDYRPVQIFYSDVGNIYYFDNTKAENILQVDGRDNYQVYDEEQSRTISKCRGEVIAYYRPARETGEAANVCVNYMDASTGKLLKTEMLPNATVGSAYSHTPKKTFAANGKLYTFDRKNVGNDLTLKTASGHPDIDWVDAYYTGKSLKKILKAPKIKKLSRKGCGKANVQIEKVKGVSGYQVMYAYNKKFKSAKKTSFVSPKITLKKLKKGKKCYVKVRAYIKTDEGKVYGPYSKRKKLK